VIMGQKANHSDVIPFGSSFELPGLDFDPMMILHGEEYLELHKPLPVEGNFVGKRKILGVYDKGKGALVQFETKMFDASGALVSRNVNSMFIRGLGGFGGSRGPNQPNIEIPKSNPDVVEKFRTAPNQAEIYRLSADYNPLHVDPEFAAGAGFKAPILHGLCSFGFSARAILKHFCNNDPKNFKAISVRFITPVYPGETLVIEMWRDPATRGRIIFQTKVAERNVTVISNAYVDVVDDGKNPASPAADLASEPVFKSAIVFEAMAQTIEKYPEIVKKVNAVFLFHVSSGDKKLTYTLDLKTRPNL